VTEVNKPFQFLTAEGVVIDVGQQRIKGNIHKSCFSFLVTLLKKKLNGSFPLQSYNDKKCLTSIDELELISNLQASK
jgi:hypothetical protein